MSIANSTATVTINSAFLQEIKEDNHELHILLAELRHRCRRPIAPSRCRLLLDRLHELRDVLAMHFSLEEVFGYFDDPAFVPPHLSEKAECLRAEHSELHTDLCNMIEWAERMFYNDRRAALAACLGPEYLDFDNRLQRHEQRENALILDACNTDLGVGD